MILGIVRKHFDKHICSSEKHFIEENKKYWKNSSPEYLGDERIYIFHTYLFPREMSIFENIIAKGVQARERFPVIAISFYDCGKATDEIDRSFEIQPMHFGMEKKDCILKRIHRFLYAKFWAYFTYGNKEKLFQIRYRKIECGDVIHDEIIRWCEGAYFDCFDISKERYFEYLAYAFEVVDKAYAIFHKNKPKYFILNELSYIPGLVASVASFLGAKILWVEPSVGSAISLIYPTKVLYKNIKISDILQKLIQNKKEKINQIKEEENRFVLEMERRDSNNLSKELGLNPEKKNVFIMVHALNDATRCGCHHVVYDNYNDWFLDTLKTIRDINNVNWIIKDHPMSDFYRQGKYVRKVFEENKTSNMYWCDKKISGMQIKEIADCVITVSGDVGIEYWSYGIPTVTVAKAYYCEWKISYYIESREKYYEVLANIDSLQKPDTESIERARQYLAIYKGLTQNLDDYTTLFAKMRKKEMTAEYSDFIKRIMLYEKNFNDFSEEFLELLKEESIKSSDIFLLNNLYEVLDENNKEIRQSIPI